MDVWERGSERIFNGLRLTCISKFLTGVSSQALLSGRMSDRVRSSGFWGGDAYVAVESLTGEQRHDWRCFVFLERSRYSNCFWILWVWR